MGGISATDKILASFIEACGTIAAAEDTTFFLAEALFHPAMLALEQFPGGPKTYTL